MKYHTLMFGWEYPPVSLGGLGVACQGLAEGLAYHNVEVSLTLPHNKAIKQPGITFVSPSDSVESVHIQTWEVPSLLQPYDTVETYEKRISEYKNVHRQLDDIYGSDLFQAIEYYTAKSIETTHQINANVVHAHDWMTYAAGMQAAQHKDVPFIAHIHATELDRTHYQPNTWIFDREKLGFESAEKIIAVSNYTKQILVDHYCIDPYKIEVVHNGINPNNHTAKQQESYYGEKRPMILFLGRLSLQKGALHFLEMAALIHEKRPDVQFVIAGGGDMFGTLVERSIELGLQDNILFAGKVDSAEAAILYKQASAFVMPSLSEPFGLVALEAALHDTPVILSKQSGASEVLDHCFKVDFWDTERMADCALTIIKDEAIANQMREHSKHTIKALHWNNQANKVKQIYEKVC